jgi:hypothetical protein
MDIIITSIYIFCTFTTIPAISIDTSRRKIQNMKNIYDSYQNGYGFDVKEAYPY